MCGIAGFAGSGSLEDLRRMTDSLAHRGPDDSGGWKSPEDSVFLGHRRLSILDLSGGHQPMFSADGKLAIVFNGEIYNYAELREELKALGHRFQTDHSDTEVLIYGYREWGERLPERLNGMWAFVIYDRDRNRLFCSRDRFGKKPFFYSKRGDTFVFGSELTAVADHPLVERNLSRRALQKYFAYGYIPAPGTVYEGVEKLPGGYNLTLDLNYWDLRVNRYLGIRDRAFRHDPRKPRGGVGREAARASGCVGEAAADRRCARRRVSEWRNRFVGSDGICGASCGCGKAQDFLNRLRGSLLR